MNVPGESTLRREFLRLQQENKSNSEALKQQQQQQLQQQQQRDPEAHIKHLLHQRQRRIEEQKEERRRVEEVGPPGQEEMRSKTGFAWPFSAFMENSPLLLEAQSPGPGPLPSLMVVLSAFCQSDSCCHDRVVTAYTSVLGFSSSVDRQSRPASVCAHLLVQLICSKLKS